MKTTTIEFRESLGNYDDKVKIYRGPEYQLIIESNTHTFIFQDDNLTLPGDLTLSGGINLGTATGASPGQLKTSADILLGGDDVQLTRLPGGSLVINLTGSSAAFTLNVGESYAEIKSKNIGLRLYANTDGGTDDIFTGASYGTNKFIMDYLGNFHHHGNLDTDGGINVGTATGATAGQIKASDSIESPDHNVLGKTLQLKPHTTAPPAASALYRGQLYLYQNPSMSNRDELYLCAKDAGAETYTWRMIDIGI